MNTAYYTFTTWSDDAMAAGFGSAAVEAPQAAVRRQLRQEGRDNVIDLTAWRAANLDEVWEELPDWEGQGLDEPELAAPPRRVRKSRRAMFTAELVSTLSVVAAAVVLIVRVLTF